MVEEIETRQQSFINAKNKKEKKKLGQYFTDAPIAKYMCSKIDITKIEKKEIRILDCGAGHGVLTVAMGMKLLESEITRVHAVLYEIDKSAIEGLQSAMERMVGVYQNRQRQFSYEIKNQDFILERPDKNTREKYDISVINPPYFKYSVKESPYAKATEDLFGGDPNIYASFIAVMIAMLEHEGQGVIISPRSFLNGLYFKGFRKYLLNQTDIKEIHTFKSRGKVFLNSEVLQENVILKIDRTNNKTQTIKISTSVGTVDLEHSETGIYPQEIIIDSENEESIIRIPETKKDYNILKEAGEMPSTFTKEGYFISTGPVVEHRTREYLIQAAQKKKESVPLIKSHNVNPIGIKWTGKHKKDIQFQLRDGYEKHLVKNKIYVIVKRFTAKDEKRRLVAGVYEPEKLESELIGITNKLNYIGHKKEEIKLDEAIGLAALFNSTFMDDYYRCISGNTQVNATDVRIMRFPTREMIKELGKKIIRLEATEIQQIEELVQEVLPQRHEMNDEQNQKLTEAKRILQALGLPSKQTNDRSAWVFLALANIKPEDAWGESEAPLLQTYVIMEFIRKNYGMDYKPNSRETIRRQTLHQFEQARIVDRNRDDPTRSTNSKDNNYSLNQPVIEILKEYPEGNWEKKVEEFQKLVPSLSEEYERRREIHKIPVTLPNGEEISLSPGKHNQLHADIIHEFCPRFIGEGGVVLYIGDTAGSREGEGGKLMHLEEEYLKDLGIPPMSHDKLPDIVVHDPKHDWIFLIEAVTSHGPVSPKRWKELEEALKDCKSGKVYVTAFPDTQEFKKNAADIAWETEVWISDKPDHMIHYNGDKFIGPR